MTRGIHLKRLSNNDLGLLGISRPETDEPAVDEAPSAANGAPPADATPHDGPIPPRAAPPPNPRLPLDPERHRGAAAREPEPPVIDLAAITREIRLGLEETLTLLDQSPTGQGQA